MSCKRCTDLEAELAARREAGRQMTRFAQADLKRIVELENKLRAVERERDEARDRRRQTIDEAVKMKGQLREKYWEILGLREQVSILKAEAEKEARDE